MEHADLFEEYTLDELLDLFNRMFRSSFIRYDYMRGSKRQAGLFKELKINICILQVKSTEDCNEKLHNIAIQLFSF